MPRRPSENRLSDLVAAATRVFIRQGYRRTQMADVADELGVAKGTVYLYVEGKEALFDLVLRSAGEAGPAAQSQNLPIATPKRGRTLRYVRERLSHEPLVEEIVAIAGRKASAEASADLASFLGKIYDLLFANRLGIKLVDRCAADHPDLAEVWFGRGRETLLATVSRFLDSRRRALRSFPDAAVAARIVLETLTFWAVHRHWDPSPERVDETAARATVIDFLCAALLVEEVKR